MSETVEDNNADSNDIKEVVAGIAIKGVLVGYQQADETAEEAINQAYDEMASGNASTFLQEANVTGQFIEGPYEAIPARSLDIGDLFILPASHTRSDSGQLVKVIGYTKPHEYGDSVFAYGHFKSEDFKGMLTAKEDMQVERVDRDQAEIDLN